MKTNHGGVTLCDESVLGLDIGTRTLKVVAATRSAGRLSVQNVMTIPIPEGLIQDFVVREPRVLGRSLRGALAEEGICGARVSFSIPTSAATLQSIELPNACAADRRLAARIQLRKTLPFESEKAFVDVEPVRHGLDSKASLAAAAPRDVVDSRAQTVLSAGLEPVAAEIEAYSVARIVERQLAERRSFWRSASVTVIDIGGASTHMYVLQNGSLLFTRAVRFGSSRIVVDVARQAGITLAEASQLLQHEQTRVSLEGDILQRISTGETQTLCTGAFEGLVREFLRLTRYFRSLHPERSFAGILDYTLLCGSLSGLNGLIDFLKKRLGLQIEVGRPLKGLLTQVNAGSFRELKRQESSYTVAVGLALGDPWLIKDTSSRRRADENEFEWRRAA